jgi:hypothetical protein
MRGAALEAARLLSVGIPVTVGCGALAYYLDDVYQRGEAALEAEMRSKGLPYVPSSPYGSLGPRVG